MTITTRYTLEEDADSLKEWLLQPDVLNYFPMNDIREVEDAVRIWIGYSRFQSGLTALYDGIPCGMANLYIQPYKKFSHQCLFSIIVEESHRGKGVGTVLIRELKKLAKTKFQIEILHLEVYEGNPAIHLYQREGFIEFGKQDHFVKERNAQYKAKIYMECYL